MDWYLESGDLSLLSPLRGEVMDYLSRHADHDEGLDAAKLAVSELVANALEHSGGPTWVSLQWRREQPVLSVSDLGPGFVPDPQLPDDPYATGGRGLYLVNRLVTDFEVAARTHGGSTVCVTLPVTRTPDPALSSPRRRTSVLPNLDEALPGGGFGRESFLRALVVQLAQTVDAEQGPDTAQAAVAQVGTDVGGQMEVEYRLARRVVERLSPQQIADCFVRLKSAIGGDFTVLEANERRIVLTNTRCPFGEEVVRAPSLCRMTSSVFGSIAASNTDHGSAVLLEERIALGDPGCRVVVWLDSRDPEVPRDAQRYRGPT